MADESKSLFSRAMDFVMGSGALKQAATTGTAAPAGAMPPGAPPAAQQSTDYLRQAIQNTKGIPAAAPAPVSPPFLPKSPVTPAGKPTSMDLNSLLQMIGGNS